MTRLAPSPTGSLHLGNARTFLVNAALARRHGWRVVLRVEDLDTPRVKAGAIEQTVDLLRWLGLWWDRGPLIQSHDLGACHDAMARLAAAGLVFPSAATRGELAESGASAPQEGSTEAVHPASRRPAIGPVTFDPSAAWRFATPPGRVEIHDAFAGVRGDDPSRTVGDFLVWTLRGVPAYQLAVVVDDARQGVTEVVRGDDLVPSAARQLLLHAALGLTPPRYWHLPLVRGADGRRLAKRHGDTRLDTYRAMGVPAAAVIGLCAWWSGIGDGPRACSIDEFCDRFDPSTMPRRDVVFTPEMDAWLAAAR